MNYYYKVYYIIPFDEKVICRLEIVNTKHNLLILINGFYEYKGRDDDDWPHWELKEKIPFLDAKSQSKLMNDALIDYFKRIDFFE